MHSSLTFGTGILFALMGLALFAYTLRKAGDSARVVKKSEQRERAAQAAETVKLRMGASILVVAGAVLMLLS